MGVGVVSLLDPITGSVLDSVTMDYFLPAQCRVDIYDVDDKKEFTDCAKMRSYYRMFVPIGLFVVFVILMMVSWFNGTLIVFTLIFGFIAALAVADYMFMAEWRAGKEYDSYKYELDRIRRDNPNYSVGEAKDVIRRERLAREQAEAARAAARTTASAINNQTFALTSMLRQQQNNQPRR